jgi:hypothetical protein
MPRGRGGARQGQPGKQYTNRTDMAQAPRAAPSKSYGEGEASLRAQKALPLPMQQMPQGPMPGAMPLDRPTERPMEPLTAGMAMGPGPGPSAAMPAVDPVLETLRAAYRAFPNESIGALLEAAEGAAR